MELQKFKNLIEPKINEIKGIIYENMPNKGDSILDSQKLNLIQKLNEFYFALNGIKEKDMHS